MSSFSRRRCYGSIRTHALSSVHACMCTHTRTHTHEHTHTNTHIHAHTCSGGAPARRRRAWCESHGPEAACCAIPGCRSSRVLIPPVRGVCVCVCVYPCMNARNHRTSACSHWSRLACLPPGQTSTMSPLCTKRVRFSPVCPSLTRLCDGNGLG